MAPDEKLFALWKVALGELEVELGKGNLGVYFRNSQLVALENSVAKINFPNKIVADQANARYYILVQNVLQKLSHQDKLSLLFTVSDQAPTKDIPQTDNLGPLFEKPKEDEEAITAAIARAHLRSDFTFEDFYVSTSNQLAFAAAQATARQPGKNYNPLFLWGGVGVGKTHLMQAIGHEILRQNPAAHVVYVSAEQFTNEIVEGIRTKNTKDFKDKYRHALALLVDDIQFIGGKDRAQEEFFHTFNTLVQNNSQVVLTSDTKPADIKFIEDRLRSRFEGGMVADISEPDHELRTAICILKAKKRGIELSTNVAGLIASSVDNIRSLEGTLQRVVSESQIRKTAITEDFVTQILQLPSTQAAAAFIDHRQILDSVCRYYSLPIKLLKSAKRDKPISEPRQILMYLLKENTRMTYEEIASYLDRADHTTIIHGVRKITNLLSTSPRIQKDIHEISKLIHRLPPNLSTS